MREPQQTRRAPGRSGKPLANPLTTRLTNGDNTAFRRMAKARNVSVYRLLAELAISELNKFEAEASRVEASSAPSEPFIPKTDPRRDTGLPREKDAHRRNELRRSHSGMVDR